MTNDEMQKKMEFIVEQRQQFRAKAVSHSHLCLSQVAGASSTAD
jgi:hypothetical protein